MSARQAPGRSAGPLSGVTIVELAALGPAPYCGMMLADMGADVIRVDRVGGGGRAVEFEPRFDVLGRGRRSLRVDLKQPRGIDTVLRVVEQADGLIEGFRPGVLERLGLGPDVLLARHPGLVIGRMTGWGQDGPLAQVPGHDINYIAVAGALANIGARGGPPVPPLNLVGDFGGGGLLLAFGMVCALFEARASGHGQVVDAAMVDGAASLMAGVYAMLAQGEFREGRGASILGGGAPFYGVYACADGEYVTVGALEPPFYAELIQTLGLDPDLFAHRTEPTRWPEQRAALEAAFRTRTRDEWTELLASGNTCCAPVLNMQEAPEHPQLRARGTFFSADGLLQPAPAPRFSRTRAHPGSPAPAPGHDTDAVLASFGFHAEVIAELHAAGVVAGADSTH